MGWGGVKPVGGRGLGVELRRGARLRIRHGHPRAGGHPRVEGVHADEGRAAGDEDGDGERLWK